MPARRTMQLTPMTASTTTLYDPLPKVLIAEDEVIIALDIERQLRQSGFCRFGQAAG
jgi:hypothetical protein